MIKAIILGLPILMGLGVANTASPVREESQAVLIESETPKKVSYNDSSYSITLSGDELAYQFENLYAYSEDITFTYESNEYHYYQDKTAYGYIQYEDSSEHAFNFVYDGEKFTNYLENGETYLDYTFNTSGDALTSNLVITASSSDYAVVKTAIEADIMANSANMPSATDLFNTIGQGVTGFVGALGSAFNSVVALFWDSTAGAPTFMGLLILLGIGAGLIYLAFRLIRGLINRLRG